MTVTAAAMKNGAHYFQKPAAPVQSVGDKDADDSTMTQTQSQASVNNTDSDDSAAKIAFGKTSNPAQVALPKLQPRGVQSS